MPRKAHVTSSLKSVASGVDFDDLCPRANRCGIDPGRRAGYDHEIGEAYLFGSAATDRRARSGRRFRCRTAGSGPARGCRAGGSHLWIVRCSRATRASCPALGSAFAQARRRSSYHCQTSFGSRAKPAGVVRSWKRWVCQKPPLLRKVGMPLSADTPAPVSTTIRRALRTAARARSTLDGIDGQPSERCLLVMRLHVEPGLVHGSDDLV